MDYKNTLKEISDQMPHFTFVLVIKGREIWIHDFIADALAENEPKGDAIHRSDMEAQPQHNTLEAHTKRILDPDGPVSQQRSEQAWTVEVIESYAARPRKLLRKINAALAAVREEAYASGDRDRLEKVIQQTMAERKGGEKSV